jgi:hypothetical protein
LNDDSSIGIKETAMKRLEKHPALGSPSPYGGELRHVAMVGAIIALFSTNAWPAGRLPAGATQEKPQTNQQQTAKQDQDKETKTVVTGTLVNQKGLPVRGQRIELYMIVNGVARDAYGAPLKGAVNVGPNRQALGMLMFPVKSETDTTGAFSLELPKYMLVPAGVQMTGWTIVAIDASGKVHTLNLKGEVVTIIPKPEETKVPLGKLMLSVDAPGEK